MVPSLDVGTTSLKTFEVETGPIWFRLQAMSRNGWEQQITALTPNKCPSQARLAGRLPEVHMQTVLLAKFFLA